MNLWPTGLMAAVAIAFSTVLAIPAAADSLPLPAGEPILHVSGAVANTNVDGAAVFDLAMLEALPAVTFTTTTIWTDGPQTFTGVSLKDLMDAVGATGNVLETTAVNDYAVDVPATDAIDGGPIVAYRLNGKEMPLREKGPLWLVYPYDLVADYQTELIYARSIWQLDRIVVRN